MHNSQNFALSKEILQYMLLTQAKLLGSSLHSPQRLSDYLTKKTIEKLDELVLKILTTKYVLVVDSSKLKAKEASQIFLSRYSRYRNCIITNNR